MSKNTTDISALQAELAKLRAENAQLKTARRGVTPELTLRVSTKGAMSIYGLGRFPVTLYISQAERVFAPAFVEKVNQFLKDNADRLTRK